MNSANNFNDSNCISNIIPFYFMPLISSVSIKAIIFGETNLGPYAGTVAGLQARLIGLSFFTLVIYNVYYVLIKIPKANGGVRIIKNVIKKLIQSSFLYFWIMMIIITLLFSFKGIYNIVYLIILSICFISQVYFIKEYKLIVNPELK